MFCGKFCTRRGQLPPCQMRFCGVLYEEHGNDDFYKGVNSHEGIGKKSKKLVMI